MKEPGFLLQMIKTHDTQYNCFPSLHVAVSVVCCYYASVQKGIVTYCVFAVWFLLLFISVLVKQQHYFYDATGGLLLGILVLVANSRLWYKRLSTI
jgi:membrane-associated phospholipid phosphatase